MPLSLDRGNATDSDVNVGRPVWQRRRSISPRLWRWMLVCVAIVGLFDLIGVTSSIPAGAQGDGNQGVALVTLAGVDTDDVETADVDVAAADVGTEGVETGTANHAGADVHDSEHTGEHNDKHEEHDEHSGGHIDPAAPMLLAIIIVLLLAKIGGDLFERFSMPAVLGELVVGVLLGNMALMTGWHGVDFLQAPDDDAFNAALVKVEANESETLTSEERALLENPAEHSFYQAGAVLKMLAAIGVVLLLFEVGLESSVKEMLSVGASSMFVAILGVVVPMGLGFGVGWLLLYDQGWQVHAFIGATLCATSVGITARVLKDLGRSQQRESQIILGAAVIDDVLGLIVLAVVSGVIQQGDDFSPMSLAGIVLKAFGFLAGAIILGNVVFNRPLFKAASYLRGHGLLVVSALVICFGFSWLANVMGLATIVGAFAAGLILEKAHYRELGHRENIELEEALQPLSAVMVPIFFVQMGIMVDLSSFKDPAVWGLALAITVVAIIGKQVCAFGVLEKGLNRTAVGLGMIPRGEVGLIFASEGAKLQVAGEPVVNAGTYSAVVVMVMLTTMITPPVLKWSLSKDSPVPESPPAPST